MSLNLKQIARQLQQDDLIVLPRWTEWMIQHGDDALDDTIADAVKTLLATKPRYRGKSFSASGAGACVRAQVLAFLDAPQDIPDHQLSNIYMDGKWRHLRWQAMLLSAGIIQEVEYPLTWPAMRSVGTMDGMGIVPNDHPNPKWRNLEFGWELKGVSTFQFGALSKDGPLEKHLDQVARYFLISGFELFSIVYEDKTTQAVKEWVVHIDDYDMRRRIADSWDEVRMLNKAVDKERLPSVLPECIRKTSDTFKACPFGQNNMGACVRTSRWPSSGTLRPQPIGKV